MLSVNSYFNLTTLYHLHELHVRFTEINAKMIPNYYVSGTVRYYSIGRVDGNFSDMSDCRADLVGKFHAIYNSCYMNSRQASLYSNFEMPADGT